MLKDTIPNDNGADLASKLADTIDERLDKAMSKFTEALNNVVSAKNNSREDFENDEERNDGEDGEELGDINDSGDDC